MYVVINSLSSFSWKRRYWVRYDWIYVYKWWTVLTLQTDYVRLELGAHILRVPTWERAMSWSGPSIAHWACIMCMNISLHSQAPASFEQEKAFYLYIVSYALNLLSCHTCTCVMIMQWLFCFCFAVLKAVVYYLSDFNLQIAESVFGMLLMAA